jgi:hypothetical protein
MSWEEEGGGGGGGEGEGGRGSGSGVLGERGRVDGRGGIDKE